MHWRRFTKEVANENGVLEKVRVGTAVGTTVAEVAKMEERTRGRRATERKAARGKTKGGKGETRACWTCGTQDTLQLGVEKVATEFCMPLKRRTVSIAEETIDIEEDLHAWCRLETCENEQWQAATSRRGKQRMKKANQTSLLSVESCLNLNQKGIIEVEDKCVKVRVTMDSGGCGTRDA